MINDKKRKVKEIENPEFNTISINLTKQLSKEVKQQNGIFFTPKSIIKKLVDEISKIKSLSSFKLILEPSCGSCEIVMYLNSVFKKVHIDAIEFNNDIYKEISNLEFGDDNQIEIRFDDIEKAHLVADF